MPKTGPPKLAASAPDLTGPTSILDWPTTYAAGRGKRRARPFSHVRIEVDLEPEVVREPRVPVLRQMEALLREREVVEVGNLLKLAIGMLHALAAHGFQRVDHWEVEPGGWLPLPEPTHDRLTEPVGHLIRALQSDAWKKIANARAFSVRLSGTESYRIDATVRRLHRERVPSLTIELRGRILNAQVHDLVGALGERLRVLHSRVAAFDQA